MSGVMRRNPSSIPSVLVVSFTTIILSLPVIMQNTIAQPIDEGIQPEKLTEGHQFTEGPFWHPDGFLLYSDIPANTVYRWNPADDSDKIFLKPSGHSNGITADMEGHLLLAQHDGKISIYKGDKKLEIVVDSYEGKRLNSPNDLTVHSNGTIYFTDPPFGVSDEDRELDISGVYRLTPDGNLILEFDRINLPNGIVLSPDESKLYVNNSQDGRIMVFDVANDGSLSNGREFASVGKRSSGGAADGMVTDRQGRLYSTGPGGIHIFDTGGANIQTIKTPERVTNLEWGGEDNTWLFLTSPTGVYRMKTNVKGFKR